MSDDHVSSDLMAAITSSIANPPPPSRCYYCGTRIHVPPHPPDTVRDKPIECGSSDCPGRRGPGTGGAQ